MDTKWYYDWKAFCFCLTVCHTNKTIGVKHLQLRIHHQNDVWSIHLSPSMDLRSFLNRLDPYTHAIEMHSRKAKQSIPKPIDDWSMRLAQYGPACHRQKIE